MVVRGIRGATVASENTEEAILSATKELLQEMVKANGVQAQDIAAVIFTATPDLDATFPAEAGRALGWVAVPLLCARELSVPHALRRCIRVLMLVNTTRSQEEIVHIYLRGAEVLRPDLST
jgi:chorismate mutase